MTSGIFRAKNDSNSLCLQGYSMVGSSYRHSASLQVATGLMTGQTSLITGFSSVGRGTPGSETGYLVVFIQATASVI